MVGCWVFRCQFYSLDNSLGWVSVVREGLVNSRSGNRIWLRRVPSSARSNGRGGDRGQSLFPSNPSLGMEKRVLQ